MKRIDWGNPFKAEDFDAVFILPEGMAGDIAKHANARFREILKEHGKRVAHKHGDCHWWQTPDERVMHYHTHTAILICEKEIE
jgi:hypothetical protein